ncbi:MAG TPA: hypothetical protein VML75_14960 [Kofleriaceae bacterium]|nr:hypothetical protein [Kofleriaceae bacterium]
MQAQEIHPETIIAPPALELARGFTAALHADAEADDREEIEMTIVCAAQHLAERGRPCDWSALDPDVFLEQMGLPCSDERAHVCFTLIGFLGWAAFHGFVDCSAAAALVEGIERSAPKRAPGHEILVDLARTTAGLLREMATLIALTPAAN